jgi:hypothetical protein
LTHDEESVLWLIGGYVIMSLCKKLSASSDSQLLLILERFKEGDDNFNDDEYQPLSKEWFNAINRGGLTRRINNFYNFFTHVESEVKKYLYDGLQVIENSKVLQILKSNTDICTSWNLLMEQNHESSDDGDYDEAARRAPDKLDKLLLFYIDFRVFVFAKRWMEVYKSEEMKTLQKSKSL